MTPRNFDLVLFIKNFARKLNFSICQDLPFCYCGFLLQVENFQKVLLDLYALFIKNNSLTVGLIARFVFSELYSLRNDFFEFGACFALQPFDKCL